MFRLSFGHRSAPHGLFGKVDQDLDFEDFVKLFLDILEVDHVVSARESALVGGYFSLELFFPDLLLGFFDRLFQFFYLIVFSLDAELQVKRLLLHYPLPHEIVISAQLLQALQSRNFRRSHQR